jgi:integrase
MARIPASATPASAAKLTTAAIKAMRPRPKRYEVHDLGCRGMYLTVFPSGQKSFVVRYRFRGLSRKLTLGSVLLGEAEARETPELDTPLSLAAAHELATAALRKVKSGTDPAAEKRQKLNAERAVESNTLQAVCESHLELVMREKPIRSIDQRRADLALICKSLGRLPLDTITREQFIHQFDIISRERGPVRADRTMMAVKRLLTWYSKRRTGYVSVLANVERRISIAERARTRVLTDDELRRVWLAAETYASPFGAYIRFVLFTAARRNEALLRRAELHDGGANWIIPADRYKTGHDTLIPLSRPAQEIIRAQPEGEWVFASASGRSAVGNLARHKKAFDAACGVSGWTLHDLRRTARTLLSRAGVAADIAERCLGHVIGGVRRVYDCHEYQREKLASFEALAALIGNIVHPPEAVVADLAAARSKRRR